MRVDYPRKVPVAYMFLNGGEFEQPDNEKTKKPKSVWGTRGGFVDSKFDRTKKK